ncbi:MAG: adenine nucleotide alpha hydrolase [Firmicutes bacterium]|nr:adenine nucleotide alpha hydrolase [Bacillota bacterium]
MIPGEKVFISWSSGKDSYLAMLKAQEAGLNPGKLLTYIDKKGGSISHGVPVQLLKQQAKALGLPQVLVPVVRGKYAESFHKVITELKLKGFKGGVFGDINLVDHRRWVEKACSRAAVNCHLPLWGMKEEDVLHELLARNVKLLIVALRRDLIEDKWLGRFLDLDFINEIRNKSLSVCGETGEYHTLVINGPLFEEELKIETSGFKTVGNTVLLDYNFG